MERFREMIRRLPAGIEFLIVVVWAFGQFIFASILSIGSLSGAAYSNDALISLLIGELLQFVCLVWFLKVRGWTPGKLSLSFTIRGTALGMGLAVATYAMFTILQLVAAHFLPIEMRTAAASYPQASKDLDMQVVFIASVVNGVYEELFVAGYVITAMSPVRGPWVAINVSTGIRLLCHLYQGPIGILTIVPMGILYGWVYVRTRALWPLIVAHILIDVVGLAYSATT
jgi:membrane protease YdiL (CAAX protease family)